MNGLFSDLCSIIIAGQSYLFFLVPEPLCVSIDASEILL